MRTSALVIGGVLLAMARPVAAAPTRKVRIETAPAGATIYLSSKEAGPVCTTPCTFDAPIGDTPLIIELESHVSLVEILSVPKRDRAPLKVSFELAPAVGTIKVDGPKGAKITIDDEDRGTAPTEIEIAAGQYIVVLTLDGKPLESLPVDVEAGGEVTLVGSSKGSAAGRRGSDGDPANGDGDGDGLGLGQVAPTPRRPAIVEASALVEIGFRDFTYDNAQTTMTLSDETEPGVVSAGPIVELYLGNLFGVRQLRGLALVGRAQFGLNKLTVSGGQLSAPVTTFWQSFEASARHRWTIRARATLEAGVGFVRDRYQFNGDIDDVRLLPDADYQSIRIGGRASLLVGSWEPYLAAENRIVLSAGALETRFDVANASGLHGSAGVAARFGALGARLEASLTRYSWTFGFDNEDEFRADGGTDSIKQIALSLGYTY